MSRAPFSALLYFLLTASAQLGASEQYFADVWVAGAKAAEIQLTLDRGPRGAISRVTAEATVVRPGLAGYSFNQVSEQVWDEGRLVYFTSTSHAGGVARRVELNGHGSGIAGLADNSSVAYPANAAPATLWCEFTAQAGALFSATDAAPLSVAVTAAKNEDLNVGGKTVAVARYEFTGDWVRSIWYAANGLFVQAVFREQGKEVRVRLRSLEAVR